MSFSLVCENCGAPSGPSVGICPYCKSSFAASDKKEHPSVKAIKLQYDKGNLPRALELCTYAEKNSPDLFERVSFLLLYAKILLECEGPSSKIKSVLHKAMAIEADNAEVLEYFEIMEAKSQLRHGLEDAGEVMLKNILRRSPSNPHAAFLLGSHLYWVEKQPKAALIYLEKAIRSRDNFLRAMACSASLYKEMGAVAPAKKLFQKCLSLEQDKVMKDFFQKILTEF